VEAVLTMAHDVFISHSHADKPAADAACAALEARGIRCWIAPRDIEPGQDWAGSIIQAIRSAQIMLLVFSRHANQSIQVKREVERAGNSGKVILPLRIDDVLPEDALEYYLSTPHWLDAITPPFEAHLEKLADACSSLLVVTGRSPQDATSDHPAPIMQAPAVRQQPADLNLAATQQRPPGGPTVPQTRPADRRRPPDTGTPRPSWWDRLPTGARSILMLAIVVVLAAVGISGYLVWPHPPQTQTLQPAPPHKTYTQSAPPSRQSAQPAPKSDVRVYNISTTGGAAESTANRLRDAGWNVTETGNLSLPEVTGTTVFFSDAPGEHEAADQVGKLLEAPVQARVPELTDQPPGVIVTVAA
jgi:hypothetical protein